MDTISERNWGMFCHLSSLAGYLIPFGHIIAPLVIWLIKRDESAFVDINGKEALNFQISITIYVLVSLVLTLLLVGIALLLAIGIADLVLIIIAGIKASKGEAYRYPLTIRFIQ